MIHPSEFGALRAFAAVAGQRSFSRAAQQLGVSASALSQIVRGLEERLGIRLLNRTTRSVSLTEAGSALLGEVAPAIDSLGGALEHARNLGKRPAGTVRLHCFHAAADSFVVPVLPGLARDYPDITLDLTIDDTVVDVVAGGYDAAIRIGEVIERDMVAIRLGSDIRQLAVASPSYLAERGAPRTPRDLLDHRCIRWRWPGHENPYAWEFFENGRWFSVAVDGPLITTSRAIMLDAVLAGVGIAFLKEESVADEIAKGSLIPLLADWSVPFPGYYLCYPQQRQMAPALRTVIDAVTALATSTS
ncbi:LysR family transcriptional regulator [Sphingomonas psychrotolerans]|uniref:LysR family transcriptional regulator n=1 Tax=Sphingomonas psychrotolerans TaxID=1327635 RepID=A0ABU3N5F2_9SPHN|nr:LysR family transcriptional regulator [Sphingomonas psychrotolerans]MDT8759623.1 LysR family transcriptional regulator [Sphingomonas psychrotolerans]